VQKKSSREQIKFITLEQFKTEVDYYAGRGMTELGILGGEPTLYPPIADAAEYAKSKGFCDITINSNGRKFHDAAFAAKLAKAGINRFCLSIHSHSEKTEDYLCGASGAFRQKMNGILNLNRLKKAGLVKNISLNPVLNNYNYKYINAFIALFTRLGVTDIRFNYIRPEGGAFNSRELVPKYADAMPYIIAAIKENEEKYKANLTFGEIPFCVYPPRFLQPGSPEWKHIGEFVDNPTNVTEFATGGGGTKNRFLWQDLKRDVLKTKTEACEKCEALPQCGGAWNNYLEMFGGGEFSPIAKKDDAK